MKMRILILQERGRHEKNRKYREALCMQRAFHKIGHDCTVWGLNYENYSIPFEEISKEHDVLLSLENYDTGWHPVVSSFRGTKVFWSIDSHCSLGLHIKHCQKNKFDILLNSTESYNKYFENLVKNRIWFPNAYPSDLIKPDKDIEKKYPIGFCGTSIPQRDKIVDIIAKNTYIKKDIFVIGDDMVKALNSYKISFNYNIADDINFRTFESTGAGSMLLTNYTPNIEKLFEINKEIVTYENVEEMLEKINFYLKNENEREKIAAAGYEKSKNYHSYDIRSEQFISIVEKL
jgi:hypothetical protein